MEWKTLCFDETQKRPCIRLTIRQNEAAFFVTELLGSSFHLLKSNLCMWKHMLWKQNGCLFQWYERWRTFCKMNKETFHAIFCHFEQQPEGKAVFKSKFSHELGEMKENLKAWPYLLELAAPTNKLRIWDQT